MSWKDHLDEFVCHRCGQCCKGGGYVWLTGRDIRRIAGHLNMTEREFVRRYTRRSQGKLALIDHQIPAKARIFYEEGAGCRIHTVKPRQCVDFPFRWRGEDAVSYCRGLQILAERFGDEP